MDDYSKKIEKILVSGDSMSPLYSDGDILIVDIYAYNEKYPSVDDIIVFKHPYIMDFLMVKKIAEIRDDGRLFVIGVNPAYSTDSRSFGTISQEAVLGKVIGKEVI